MRHRKKIIRYEERMARQQKRKFEEMEVSDMHVSNSAMVHGVIIGAVSPVKESRAKVG